jgi:xylose isomerase
MKRRKRYQSVCRWSFHPGKGGFVPDGIRPGFAGLTTEGFVELVAGKVAPRLPANTKLGVAVHYDREVDEKNAEMLAKMLGEADLALSMLSPGAHYYYGYGGLGSLDEHEREEALAFAKRALDLLAGPLAEVQNPECPAVFDIWNGSFGYEIPSVLVTDMLKRADDAIAGLIEYAAEVAPGVKLGLEPKPNEGHAAMLYQTSGEVLALRSRLRQRGADVSRFGLINEFGHTEMAGLDLVQEYAAAALEGAIVHVHANSQGGDGVRLGGAGKFDMDFGVAPTASTLAVAQILAETGYEGWIEHDMQPRPYDSEEQNVDHVVRSLCNWEAIARTVEGGALDRAGMEKLAAARDMVAFEDVVRGAVAGAHALSKELYESGKIAGGIAQCHRGSRSDST